MAFTNREGTLTISEVKWHFSGWNYQAFYRTSSKALLFLAIYLLSANIIQMGGKRTFYVYPRASNLYSYDKLTKNFMGGKSFCA